MKRNYLYIICVLLFVYPNLRGQAPVDPTVWKFKTSGPVYSTPLIKNDSMFIGSLDSCFYAISATTGQQLWKYKTRSQINTTASIYDNILCFGSGNYLYGLDLKGNFKWEFKMYDGNAVIQNDDWDYFNSSPQLVDSIAYIGTEKGLVYGVNVKNGEQVFKCQATDVVHTIETTPVIYDGKIFFGNWDGLFYAYDLKTSQKVWEYDTDKDNHGRSTNIMLIAHATLFNDNIYFCGRGGFLYCLNPTTGVKKWQYRDPSGLWILGLTRQDSTFYLGSSYQFIIRSVNAMNGKQNWTTGVDYISYGSPCVDTTFLFSGTGNDAGLTQGSLYATDKKTGVIKNRLSVSGRVQSSPILYKDKLYFGCGNGYIYMIDKQKFVNVEYPKISFRDKQILNISKKPLNSTFDTTIYLLNMGKTTDSISFTSSRKEMTMSPTWSLIKPGDSVKVNVTINATGLKARNYSSTLVVQSYYGMFKERVSKFINFEVYTNVSAPQILNDSKVLRQYPNPLYDIGTVEYILKSNANVSLAIYDCTGKAIALLEKGYKIQGPHQLNFDSKSIPQGIYFCRLTAGDDVYAQKMMVVK